MLKLDLCNTWKIYDFIVCYIVTLGHFKELCCLKKELHFQTTEFYKMSHYFVRAVFWSTYWSNSNNLYLASVIPVLKSDWSERCPEILFWDLYSEKCIRTQSNKTKFSLKKTKLSLFSLNVLYFNKDHTAHNLIQMRVPSRNLQLI